MRLCSRQDCSKAAVLASAHAEPRWSAVASARRTVLAGSPQGLPPLPAKNATSSNGSAAVSSRCWTLSFRHLCYERRHRNATLGRTTSGISAISQGAFPACSKAAPWFPSPRKRTTGRRCFDSNRTSRHGDELDQPARPNWNKDRRDPRWSSQRQQAGSCVRGTTRGAAVAGKVTMSSGTRGSWLRLRRQEGHWLIEAEAHERVDTIADKPRFFLDRRRLRLDDRSRHRRLNEPSPRWSKLRPVAATGSSCARKPQSSSNLY
jgi:hypothetical protein